MLLKEHRSSDALFALGLLEGSVDLNYGLCGVLVMPCVAFRDNQQINNRNAVDCFCELTLSVVLRCKMPPPPVHDIASQCVDEPCSTPPRHRPKTQNLLKKASKFPPTHFNCSLWLPRCLIRGFLKGESL